MSPRAKSKPPSSTKRPPKRRPDPDVIAESIPDNELRLAARNLEGYRAGALEDLHEATVAFEDLMHEFVPDSGLAVQERVDTVRHCLGVLRASFDDCFRSEMVSLAEAAVRLSARRPALKGTAT